MNKELKYISLVALALVVSIPSEFCVENPIKQKFLVIVPSENQFNPYCYIKNFDPKKPNLPNPYKINNLEMSGISLSTVYSATMAK